MMVIRRAELLRTTRLSYTTIYRMMKRGEFPRQVQIGSRAVADLCIHIRKQSHNHAENIALIKEKV